MLHDISKSDYRIATEDEKDIIKEKARNMDLTLFEDAPVVMDDGIVYAVVEGVAYPLKEIAEVDQ